MGYIKTLLIMLGATGCIVAMLMLMTGIAYLIEKGI